MDIKADNTYVNMGGGLMLAYAPAKGETAEVCYLRVRAMVRQLVDVGGVLEHEEPEPVALDVQLVGSAPVARLPGCTLVRLIPGTVVQVLPGPLMQLVSREQRAQAMRQGMGGPTPFRG